MAAAALFHMEGITPEAGLFAPPQENVTITRNDLDQAAASLSDAASEEVDFVSLGCPHLTIRRLAGSLSCWRGGGSGESFG